MTKKEEITPAPTDQAMSWVKFHAEHVLTTYGKNSPIIAGFIPWMESQEHRSMHEVDKTKDQWHGLIREFLSQPAR